MSKSEDDDGAANLSRADIIRHLRGITRKRGRPRSRRKGRLEEEDVTNVGATHRVAGSAMNSRQAYAPLDQKPREERSYEEFYPLLDTSKPIRFAPRYSVKHGIDNSSVARDNENSNEIDEKDLIGTLHMQVAKSVEPMTSEDIATIMARAPKPAVQKIEMDDRDSITESIYQCFGYKTEDAYVHPEGHYVRSIEPTEKDLENQVEYDMDEQDDAWLKELNMERRKESADEVSNEAFEIIMDNLEKEWFKLMKNMPKPESNEDLSPEDSACAICDDTEAENSNAIVFCDGCNLAVHQDCYGVPYIPEGQWLCRKCMISPENPVSCVFCPNEGGAFKQTTNNKWGHLLCAIWIPEVGISNTVYMEPIDNIELIPKSRWKLTCYICRQRMGACIQCDNRSCFTAFHVTCARKAKLFIKMKTQSAHMDGGLLRAFCDRHGPIETRDEVAGALEKAQAAWKENQRTQFESSESDSEEGDDQCNSDADDPKKSQKRQRVEKSKAAYQHTYTLGAPLVPQVIVDKIMTHIAKLSFRKKINVVQATCKYWSLKRESRRGAPLLKRLHLEPWTACRGDTKETEAERLKRIDFVMNLRKDLERLRMLAELVRKREREKLRKAQNLRDAIDALYFPLYKPMSRILDRLLTMDKNNVFLYPVPPEEAPDYYRIITNPMNFSLIKENVENQEYDSFESFQKDILLVFSNAMRYNKSDTVFYKLASRMKGVAQTEIEKEKAVIVQKTIHEEASERLELNESFFELEYEPEPKPVKIGSIQRARKSTRGRGRRSSTRTRPTSSRITRMNSVQEQESLKGRQEERRRERSNSLRKGWVYEEDDTDKIQVEKASELSERDLFAHFNDGWVLSESRRKRARISYAENGTTNIANLVKTDESKQKQKRGRRKIEKSPSPESSLDRAEWTKDSESASGKVEVAQREGAEEQSKVTDAQPDKTSEEPLKANSVKDSKQVSFNVGDIVWAKMPRFPWHPAIIHDEKDSKLSKSILSTKTEQDAYLVYFFDDKIRTFRFVPGDKVIKLGVDDAIDRAKLNDKSIKSARIRRNVKVSYDMAIESMEKPRRKKRQK